MCLSPITIPNQTKYISLSYRDPFLLQVPCGHCSECQTTLGNQWYFRASYEWQSAKYVLFDTLTYRDDALPHLSDTWSLLDKKDDFPCFDYTHIRKFLQLLRMRLIRAGYRKDAFRYFLSSEYGTSEYYMRNGKSIRATHRPHYHVLFYVQDSRLDPLYFSDLIAKTWTYGRTDGLPYRGGNYVLSKNVIRCDSPNVVKLRTCRYVTKYVQKSCQFDKEITRRVNLVMYALSRFASDNPDTWLSSESARRERLKLLRMVNQFHRQSHHFGEEFLSEIDLNSLYQLGGFLMSDPKSNILFIPLPMYYKRKLFFDLVSFNGSRYWVKNELGKEYDLARKQYIYNMTVNRYKALCDDYRLDYNPYELANYVIDSRGRIRASKPSSTLLERCNEIDLVNYSSSSDKLQFGSRFLTDQWLGDSQQGYISDARPYRITLKTFIDNYVDMDEKYERQLSNINSLMQSRIQSRQRAYELRQKLTNLYKSLYP